MTRRPLPKSDVRVRLAVPCTVWTYVRDQEHRRRWHEFGKDQLNEWHLDELLKYQGRDMLFRRLFLIDDNDQDLERRGKLVSPAYLIGWPGQEKTRVVGAKQAVAFIRAWWPERDMREGQDEGELGLVEPAAASKVVPITGPQAFRDYWQHQER